jgi:hypothetical protein
MARSTLIDEVVLESATGNLSVNGLVMTAVPNTVVSVPTTGRKVLLSGRGPLRHSVNAAMVALGIAPVGSTLGQQDETAYAVLGTAGTFATCAAEHEVDPFSPGDYQLFVLSTTSGNIVIDASANRRCRLRATYL